MATFIVERVRTAGEIRIGCGRFVFIARTKRLSLPVVMGMLAFVQSHRDAKDKPADQILASLFKGAEKAVVQIALNKLAANELIGRHE